MRAVLAPVSLSLVAVVALGVVGCGGGTPSAEPSVSLVSSSAPSASSTSRLMPSVRPVRVFAAQVASAESVLAAPGSTAGAVRGVMRWPRSILGYRSWRVLYRARSGVWVLPLGYPKAKAIRLSAD